jgi:ketosteroid isomerase-like protein
VGAQLAHRFPRRRVRGQRDRRGRARPVRSRRDLRGTLPDHIGETYRGHEGVARAIERWSEPYRELTVYLEHVYGSGDCVVWIHRVRVTALYSGLAIEMPLAYLWRFRAGKVVYFRSFRDPAEALTAAGLSGTEPTSSGPPPDRPASTRSE